MCKENNGIANALSPAICVCTVLVSIGPIITQYYFSITLTFFISLIFLMEYASHRKSRECLQQRMSIQASYFNQNIEKQQKQKNNSSPVPSRMVPSACKRVAKMRENFSKTKDKNSKILVETLNTLVEENEEISTKNDNTTPSKNSSTSLPPLSTKQTEEIKITQKYSDSQLMIPKKKKLGFLKSKLGKTYHMSIDATQPKVCRNQTIPTHSINI